MLTVLRMLNIKERLFISFFLLSITIIPAVKIISEYQSTLTQYVESEIAHAQEDLYIAHQYILFESWNLRYTTLSLSEQSTLLDYVRSPNRELKANLEHAWRAFFLDNMLTKRITLLDLNGIEKIRVEYDTKSGSIIIPTHYESKADYPFFIRAKKMDGNDLFYHALDLLVDHGQFVKPYELAYRVVKPIEIDGKRMGYLVLHANMERFEENIQSNIDSKRVMYKVDAHGFYIKGQEPKKLYGGALPEHNNANIRIDFPILWQKMLTKNEGIWEDKTNYYIFRKHIALIGESEPFYVMYYQLNKEQLAYEAYVQSKPELFLMIGIWVLVLLLSFASLTLYLLQKKKASSKLYKLAYHDPLTQLYNRIRFEQEIKKHIDKGDTISLIYVDLHELRRINESYSYQVGDSVLLEIGNRLQHFKYSMVAARVADNSFAILVNGSDKNQLKVYISALQQELLKPINIGSQFSIRVTTTLGIARLPNDAQTSTELLLNANTAANRLRNQSNQGYKFYQEELSQTAIRYMTMRGYIEDALKNDYFYLEYQPKVHCETQMLVGLEALVRIAHPTEGKILPDEFLIIAEKSGLIHDVDLWVLRKACEQGRKWLDENKIFGSIAINTTTDVLADINYFTKVRQVLNETKIPANYLKIEVTERIVLPNNSAMIDNLRKLSQLGVILSIDDFGTGYSSFNYINRLPIKELKIDRSFVQKIEKSSRSEQVVQAITAISKALEIDVVAEGVETQAQIQALKKLGCYIMQGDYYSEAVPVKELEKWFQ